MYVLQLESNGFKHSPRESQRNNEYLNWKEIKSWFKFTCIRKKLRWSKQIGKAVERPGEQFIELPLAISDHEGNPIKGQKSYTTRAYNTRYKNKIAPITTLEFPAGWKAECSIIEGMFMINSAPLGSHRKFG